MDVKNAVSVAKVWLEQTLSDEGPFNIGLDEVEFDEMSKSWKITLGFSRPWNSIQPNALTSITGMTGAPKRSYRVIEVDDSSGEVVSMKRRLVDVE
jgi:hypothetical protein